MSHPIVRTSQDFASQDFASQDLAAQPFSVPHSITERRIESDASGQTAPQADGQCQAGSSVEFFILLLSIAAGADTGHAS